jgi:hypothetical protein
VLLRKRAAGTRLQIFFEGESALFNAEPNIGLQPPRPELGSMNDLAGVVLGQSRRHAVGDADLEMLGIVTFEDVDVFHEAWRL